MFYIKINNEIITQNVNLYDIIINFNEMLSTNDNTYDINYINNDQNTIIIELEFNNKNIKLESDNEIKLSCENIILLPFFIFPKNVLDKLDIVDLSLITKLNPQLLLDVFTYNKSLLNPYYVLSKIFHINDDFIYQSFILYLNNTISVSIEKSQFNVDIIVNNFICHNTFNNSKYKNLFMYYIGSKQILPFRIKYQKYVSKFDLI